MTSLYRYRIMHFFLALGLCVGIASCSPQGPASTAPPSQRTPPAQPTGTTSPTNTQTAPSPPGPRTPSATKVPLSDVGPWLVYSPEFHELFVTDLSGEPNEVLGVHGATTLAQGTSSRGLFAYVEESQVSQLVIVALPSLMEQLRLPLLDASIQRTDGEEYLSEVRNSVRLAPQWSPNGRYLAFSASLDGPSADLYVYDADSRQLHRATSGPNQIGTIWWSPHSDWIVHEEVESFFGWMVRSVWAARPRGNETKWLYSPRSKTSQALLTWLSPVSFISYTHAMDGDCDVRLVNLDIREASPLFSGCAYSDEIAADPNSGTVAFVPAIWEAYASEDDLLTTPFPTTAVYTVSPFSTEPALIVDGAYQVAWDPLAKQFSTNKACPSDPSLFVSFEVDGTANCLPPRNSAPSPDGEYTAVSGPDLSVYTASGNLLSEVTTIPNSWELAWAPDSGGILVESNGMLTYFSIPRLAAAPMAHGPSLTTGAFGWAYNRP